MYIKQAYKGYNDWWRYLLTLLIAFMAQVIGSIPLGIIVAVKSLPNSAISDFQDSFDPAALGLSQNMGLIILMIPMVLTFFALVLAIRYIHGHTLKNVFTSANKFRWKNFFFGFAFWGGLLTIAELINYQIQPENYVYNFNPSSFYQLVLIALLMIPLQAGAEELFFRGNLMQGVGVLTKSRLIALLFTSLAFGLMHYGNPEVKEFGFGISMAYYIGFGLLMGLLVIFDGGLEMPLAIHAINNIYGAVFVGYSGSVLQTPALFKILKYNPTSMLLLFILASIIYLIVSKKVFKWKNLSTIFQPVNKELE